MYFVMCVDPQIKIRVKIQEQKIDAYGMFLNQ